MNWPHRVVITGTGVVSPVGLDSSTYWNSLKEGVVGIGEPTAVDPALLSKEVVAEVKGYEPSKYFDERALAPLDRVSQIAVVAAREAVAQSGIDLKDLQVSERTAAIVGTGIGGSNTIDDSYKRLYRENATRIYPLTVPKLMPNAPASQVSMHLGARWDPLESTCRHASLSIL